MPSIEWFAYCFPNRRSDKTVVEITLNFVPADQYGFPQHTSDIKSLLLGGGVLEADEVFPEEALPDDRIGWYTSLLVQTALLFQRKAGHRVGFYSVSCYPDLNRSVALLEHEHCDVGMTAVKLAVEVIKGDRKLLVEPFLLFKKFADDRLLPAETEAIIKVAQRRDIPCIQLERQPYKREDFQQLTGGKCISRNGLLMLGHGEYQHVIDGTYCLDKSEDFKDVLLSQGKTNVNNSDVKLAETTAEGLLDWLFPEKASVRMPVIAITGTNGKTTTSRMINHILMGAGRKPGMVCTDGVFLNGRQVSEGDECSDTGHLKVLTSKHVNMAVLETHHAGILCRGFAFDWCDIAICLNVSEDHLGDSNVDTLEEMAALKQALPERARQAAVLNADDLYCRAMVASIKAEKVCMVSIESSVEEIQALAGNDASCFCVLELIENQQWMVIHDQGRRLIVMKVSSIPATFDGTARFNVSNAMHAVSAAYLSGIHLEEIRNAMSGFATGYESTPGRLNIFDDLPFRIIMDFAHNPDGMRRLSEFIDQQDVPGRKLIAFAASTNRLDETIRNMARSVAGHFDFYYCRNMCPARRKSPERWRISCNKA